MHHFVGMYTDQCRKLGVSICLRVSPIVIYEDGSIRICGVLIDPADEQDLIRDCGFDDRDDLMAFFSRRGEWPIECDLISWNNLKRT